MRDKTHHKVIIVAYVFRQATEIEKESIFNLYCMVMNDFISEIWGWDEKWQENNFSKYFKAEEVTVVYQESELVGYSHIQSSSDQLYLRMMAIHPKHQKKEIGKKLLEAFITCGKKQSKSLGLQVFKINTRAILFYEKHGFIVKNETANSYIMKSNA